MTFDGVADSVAPLEAQMICGYLAKRSWSLTARSAKLESTRFIGPPLGISHHACEGAAEKQPLAGFEASPTDAAILVTVRLFRASSDYWCLSADKL